MDFLQALRLSVGARQATSVGQIVNIMSTDARRMQELTTYLQMVWSAPLQITLSVVFLWRQVSGCVCGVVVLSHDGFAVVCPLRHRVRVCPCV